MCVGTTEDRRGYQIPWLSLYCIRSQGSLWMIVVREQRQNQSGVDSPPHTHTYSHKHTHTQSHTVKTKESTCQGLHTWLFWESTCKASTKP